MKKRFVSDNENWMLDWDYKTNSKYNLFPDKITVGSRERVFWICHVCGGKWDTVVKERRGCPFCAGLRALPGYNDLATLQPHLLNEWDYEANTVLPSELTVGSRRPVSWRCKKGHPWIAEVRSRTKGKGCPYCANKELLKGFNDLTTTHPELAVEWDYEKNAPYLPDEVITGSKKPAWWKCSVCGNEWEALISNRCKGTGCPYCANKKVLKGFNGIATTHPEIMPEWDYEKNTVDPSSLCGGNTKVWWKCKKGHSWKAAIQDRIRGTGCPECSKELRVSFPEKSVLYYVQKYYDNVMSNYRADWLGAFELDIFLPEYKIAIEYDGKYGHASKQGALRDLKKDDICHNNGVQLISIREIGCPDLNSTSISFYLGKNNLTQGIAFVLHYINEHINNGGSTSYDIDIERDSGQIYSLIEYSEKKNSLAVKYPDTAQMWHPSKNGTLRPEYVYCHSERNVWWKCSVCGNEWRRTINNQIISGKCPYCYGKKIAKGQNDLATTDPILAKEWDYDLNNGLTPSDVTAKYRYKVWWKCSKGHSWDASVYSRHKGNGCPFCSNRKLLTGYNDVASYKELLDDWDYDNKKAPKYVCIGSTVKYKWKCHVCGYKWEVSPSDKIRRKNCPSCAVKQRAITAKATHVKRSGSLAQKCPELLLDWDFNKNTDYSPDSITANCRYKVWWKCHLCGNEWQATVTSRNRGRGCPDCAKSNRRNTYRNNLLKGKEPITITHPGITSEWNYSKNELGPEKYTAGSGISVWWKCSICGNEWPAKICERTRGRGKCPACKKKHQ